MACAQVYEKMGCTGECRRDADVYLTRAITCSSPTTQATCTGTTAPCGEGSGAVEGSPSGGVAAMLGAVCAALAAAAVLVV